MSGAASIPPRPRKKPISAGRGADQFPLRLPDGMREKIKAEAEENGRSMNQEIIEVLRDYFPAPPDDEEILDQLIVALNATQDFGTVGKRELLSGHLREFIEKIKERKPDQAWTEPVVVIDRAVLAEVDHLALWFSVPRHEIAENLIKSSLLRMKKMKKKSMEFVIGWYPDEPQIVDAEITNYDHI